MKTTYWLIAAWLITQNALVLADDDTKIATEVTVQTGKIIQTTLRRYVKAFGTIEPTPVRSGKSAASSKIAALIILSA